LYVELGESRQSGAVAWRAVSKYRAAATAAGRPKLR